MGQPDVAVLMLGVHRMSHHSGTAQQGQAMWMTGWLLAAIALLSGMPVSAEPLIVPGARQLDLTSSKSDFRYRIFIGLPEKATPPDGYSVLYVLDGNRTFLTALEAVRTFERRPDAPKDRSTIVVGIGYPDGVDIATRRTLDLTPPGSGHPRIRAPSGGSDDFYAFLVEDVHPYLAARWPIASERQGIYGHSFAGLFVLDVLAKHPTTFRWHMAASPSIWFHPPIRDNLARLVKQDVATVQQARLLLTVGEYEQTPSPTMRAQADAQRMIAILGERKQVDAARNIASLFSTSPGIEAAFAEIQGEDHGSVIPASINRAVYFMLSRTD